jgi:uncharacterized iron-regulated membrane protein
MLAVTSVSMNLKEQVMRPLVTLAPVAVDQQKEPKMGRAEILAIARAEAERRGLTAPAGGIFLVSEFGIYGVGFFEPGNSHGDGGLGNPWLYFDSESGKPLGGEIPGQGTAGGIFLQAMFPLHSGRIAGVPGRILVSLMGLVIATLSVTGIVIWSRKRKARQARKERVSEALATPRPTRSCG